MTFAQSSSFGSEAVSPVHLDVVLTGATSQTGTVHYSVTGGTADPGTDFSLTSGTLTFQPGELSQTITFTVVNDEVVEPNESVVVSLSDPVNLFLGPVPSHSYIILNDDGIGGAGGGGGFGGSLISGNGNNIGVIIIGDGNQVGDVNVGNSTSSVVNNSGTPPKSKPGKSDDDDHEGDDDNHGKSSKQRDNKSQDSHKKVSVKYTKDSCKKGGWKDIEHFTFKNQGQCVSYFARMR